MFNFPEVSRVSVPATRRFPGKFAVSVRVQPGDDLQGLREFYQERLEEFEITGKVITDLEFFQSLAGTPVRFLAADVDLFQTSTLIETLSLLKAVVVVEPEANLIRKINFLTSFDLEVCIDSASPPRADRILKRALDFYVHSPMLNMPIEPFHSLLCTISQGLNLTLWDIAGERVAYNFFVSDGGEVSLSRRWHARGFNYGSMNEPGDNLKETDLFRRLSSFRFALFQSCDLCVFCAHLDLCGGFLRALEANWPCDSWRQVFHTLCQEAKNAKELLQKIDGFAKSSFCLTI